MAEIVNPDGRSPYRKYGKREYDYSAMYNRAPHLRRPLEKKTGQYEPHVNNPFYRSARAELRTDQFVEWRAAA